jgi:hypothetical protein
MPVGWDTVLMDWVLVLESSLAKIVPKLDGGWKDGLGQEDVFVGGIDVLDIGTALGFNPKDMKEMISKLLRMRGLVL